MLRLASLALAGWLLVHLAGGDGGTTLVVLPAAPPVIVTVPAPAPAVVASAPAPMPLAPVDPAPAPRPVEVVDDREGLGPCPAPYTRTSDVPITPPPGFDVDDVAASAFDVRLLAAWNDDEIRLSVDEGRTWQAVLAHDGAVADARFDCHGRLHVLRGAQLGTYDDALAGPERERWTALPGLEPAGEDRGRLLPDGGGVAVIGSDVAAHDRLVLVRRDARGRWRPAPLARVDCYGSWDGISVLEVQPLAGGRFRLRAMPWQGGECGYSRYLEVAFDLDLRRVRVVQHGEEEPAGWAAPSYQGLSLVRRDRAGRWLAVADGSGDLPPLVRLDAAELAALRAPAD